MKNKKFLKGSPFLTLIVLALVLFTAALILRPLITPFKILSFKIGNFTYGINSNAIYIDPQKGLPAQESTKLSDYQEERNCGTSVEGIKSLFLDKKALSQADQPFAGRIMMYSWNENDLKHRDEHTGASFQKLEQDLSGLSIGKIEIPKNGQLANTYNLEPFIYCLNGYRKIILTDKIETPKFSSVYYQKALEGNGTYSFPNRELIIRKGQDWLIIKEEHTYTYDRSYNPFSACFDKEHGLVDTTLSCVVGIWRDKYRYQTEINKWINQTLNAVELL